MTLRSIAIAAGAAALTLAVSAAAQTTPPKTPPKQTTPPKTTTPAKTPAGRGRGAPATGAASKAALMDPSKLTAAAPAVFQANFVTSVGDFVIEVHRDWAPKGADRFYNLVKNGFYDDCRFFRVVPNFMVQFGINGDPAIQQHWRDANIPDDPVKQSNKRGFVTFANAGPNTRSTQIFISFVDRNAFLDATGFAPFGQVISGMETVDKINSEYGEGNPDMQPRLQREGNKYLAATYARMDYVKKATIVKAPAAAPVKK
jgi:peptidyl-prolyl cis-trans isomerase A (cyclophilin A)